MGAIAIADTSNNRTRFVPATSGTYFGRSMTAGDIYTIAGNGTAGYLGDTGAVTSAELSGPQSVTFDASGDLAIADTSNNVIRFVPASRGNYFGRSMAGDDIDTIAGTGTAGYSGTALPRRAWSSPLPTRSPSTPPVISPSRTRGTTSSASCRSAPAATTASR